MKIKLFIALIFCISVSACGDNESKVIGVYKHSVALTGKEMLAEVRKDGDSYIFVGDAIRNKNILALSRGSDGLSYNNIPLKVSEDGNMLYFGRINAVRVEQAYLLERIADLENNKKICSELQAEADQNKISMSKEQWNAYSKSLDSKKPDGCYIVDAGVRW